LAIDFKPETLES